MVDADAQFWAVNGYRQRRCATSRRRAAIGSRWAISTGPGVDGPRCRDRRFAVPGRRRRSVACGPSSQQRPRRSAVSTTSGRTSACRSQARWSRPASRTSIAHSRSTSAHTPSCAARQSRTCARPAVAPSASRPPTPRCSRSPSSAPYAVTKAAALALARQVARDYSGEGIRVNALCPGWIDTPLQHAVLGEFRRPRALSGGGAGPRAARAHRHARGGGEARLLPALGRCRVHDRPRARRRRRRVAARLSPALRCYAHDGFAYPLPAGHRFPLGKYALLRERAALEPRLEVR